MSSAQGLVYKSCDAHSVRSSHTSARRTSAENMMTKLESKMRDVRNIRGSSPISGKVRRRRTVYSRTHLDLLLKTFETNPYPGISLREKLSQITGVHESRIQVWFQNRRARKNKKTIPQESENLHQEEKLLQFNPVAPGLNQSPWSEKEFSRMGFHGIHEHPYKHCAGPIHPLSHLHMNSFAGPQQLNNNFPYQAANIISSGQLTPTDSTAQQDHPYMQAVSGSHLSHGSDTMERNNSEYKSSVARTPEPVHGASQEPTLQDILEEFQPCWTEEANNFSDIPDDLLSLF